MDLSELKRLAELYPPETVQIPIEFPFAIRPAEWKVEGGQLVQHCVGIAVYPVDARRVLAEFLSLPRGELKPLIQFLERYGQWDEGNQFPLQRFWELQDTTKELLSLPAEMQRKALRLHWLDRTFTCSLGSSRRIRSWTPVLRFRLESIVDAINAVIQIDVGVMREKWKKCRRPDCPHWFKATSAHKRLYHTRYCGHLQSIRKNRRKRRQERRKH
jgi:hypothetical protein